jgi:serpin B
VRRGNALKQQDHNWHVKGFVAVDEKGTEAAAATAVIALESAAPVVDVTLAIDRPFIFLIRDIPTGQILFIGRVLNPAP